MAYSADFTVPIFAALLDRAVFVPSGDRAVLSGPDFIIMSGDN